MKIKHVAIMIISIIALILFIVINPIIKINAGERGVVLEWGAVQDRILDEGIHWILPIRDSVKKMDVTIQKEEREASAASKDLQIVTSKVAINYHLDLGKVNKLYQELRRDYSDRVIAPAIEEYIKKTTANFTAEELVTKREDVKEELKLAISGNLLKNGIIVDDVFITDFAFSAEFDKAIEAKVTAEQRALESKNKLEQVKYEAEQRITQAKAEAESIRIQAEAIMSQGGKDYVSMKAVEKWDGRLPETFVPGSAVPFIDVLQK